MGVTHALSQFHLNTLSPPAMPLHTTHYDAPLTHGRDKEVAVRSEEEKNGEVERKEVGQKSLVGKKIRVRWGK